MTRDHWLSGEECPCRDLVQQTMVPRLTPVLSLTGAFPEPGRRSGGRAEFRERSRDVDLEPVRQRAIMVHCMPNPTQKPHGVAASAAYVDLEI